MKVVAMLLLVLLLAGEIILLARAAMPQKEEVGVVVDSNEEAASVVLLELLAFDVVSEYASDEEKRDAEISKQASESYIETQIGLGSSDQDEKDKEKIRKAVRKYSHERAKLKAEWESNVPESRHFYIFTNLLPALQKDCSRVFKGTKAFAKVLEIVATPIEPDQQ